MTETDLQLGGGYTYQWECAILLALNYFLEPVCYSPDLFDLIHSFLGRVGMIHLEGEDRENGIDLEDINLITDDRSILIQVKTKQAEGERWTLSDPLLLKALHRFYDSCFLAEGPEATRFAFLTNRPFNPDLVALKDAIREGEVAACTAAQRLGEYVDRYARRAGAGPLNGECLCQMLARTRFVQYLGVDAVKANIQAKLQALGREDWQMAHAVLFEDFARRSTRVGGGVVTRETLTEVLGPPTKLSGPAGPPVTYRIDTGGAAFVGGNVHVHGGDFVGGDQTKVESPPSPPRARPRVPSEGEPLDLITAALKARRLLMVWADVPFPPEERPAGPVALRINRWQENAQTLEPFAWPVAELPPVTILSLDPSDRIEAVFRKAQVPLHVLCGEGDVADRSQHNLIKLGGDLPSRSGLLLSWAEVRDAPNQRDKVHLLSEARRVARGGVVVMFADQVGDRFSQLWKEVVRTYLGGAQHCFALGPRGLRWPGEAEHLSEDVNGVLARLTDVQVPPLKSPSPEQEPYVLEMRGIDRKLELLLDGLEGLRARQRAIYRRLGQSQRETVAQVMAGLREGRLDDAEVQRALHGTLDAVRRTLLHLQQGQELDLDDDIKQTLGEVTEILRAGVDLRTGLEWSVPIIPFLLTYKTTLEAGTGVDLRQLWEDLVELLGDPRQENGCD